MNRRHGFTLVEVLTSIFIALYVVMGAWSVYVMAVTWWNDIAPKIEVQRITRLVMHNVVTGRVDATAGTYVIGSSSFSRRNGISGATAAPTITSPERIDFALEPDSSNCRAFYMATDPVSGLSGLYYMDSGSNVRLIAGTLGLTSLVFEKVGGSDNLIKVTAVAEKSGESSSISEVTYLRNVIIP